jgi:hypothetical protein
VQKCSLSIVAGHAPLELRRGPDTLSEPGPLQCPQKEEKHGAPVARSILTATIGHNNCFVNVTDIAIRSVTFKEPFHEPVRIHPDIE